jgi:hypothetical protein
MMGAEVPQLEFLSATKPFAGGTINRKWGSMTSGEQKNRTIARGRHKPS